MRPRHHAEFRYLRPCSFPFRITDGTKARFGNCVVLFVCSLSDPPEAMQNVGCFVEFGDVHHAVDATRVLDPKIGRGDIFPEQLAGDKVPD